MKRDLPLKSSFPWPTVTQLLKNRVLPDWPRLLLVAGLLEIWLMVLLDVPAGLPLQWASWFTFIGLLVTPGYFLADIITYKLELDLMERLALAMPCSVAILAVPGTIALVQHRSIEYLSYGWMALSAAVIVVWMLHLLWVRSANWFNVSAHPLKPNRWAVDEIVLFILLAIGFMLVLPTLTIVKIDGDAYAVNSFSADALAGLPLNLTEPIFGTALGPGVRMVFNQFLSISYLWAYFSQIDPNTLIAQASRPMIALWALLASYMLGKAAGGGQRRFGLYTVSLQFLVYLAAPFWRGDNVSLFFFERTNADKFMVPMTMLPVVFALSIRLVKEGKRQIWLAAAIVTFAVSTIHPLIAVMLALALGAFSMLHLALGVKSQLEVNWRKNPGRWLLDSLRIHSATISRTALKRCFALWLLIAIVMALPILQLFLSRGEAPLASSYPSTLEGWSVGEKLIPALPFVHVPSLDVYGPLPELSHLSADEANSATNPFLIWRVAVNMNRQRLIMFNLNDYISDPSLMLEPVYLLALLLLPLLFINLRRDIGAQFVVSVSLAILFVMFNPFLTPLIGSLVMPWILWRFVWLFPYALIIALATYRLINGAVKKMMARLEPKRIAVAQHYASAGFIIILALAFSPAMVRNIQDLNFRETSPFFYPTPKNILSFLSDDTAQTGSVTVLADSSLSVTLPAYVANAAIVAHRAPTTSEVFPADRQAEALQRLIDQDYFFNTAYLTQTGVDIINRYHAAYIIAPSGSDMEMQLRLAPQWFQWLMDDQSYSLYRVVQPPTASQSILGNTALLNGEWETAQHHYQQALNKNRADLLALIGLAEIDHAHGRFDEAINRLTEANAQIELPAIHHRLGEIYAEQGNSALSIAEFETAQKFAPQVSRFHTALGNACLNTGNTLCAAEQFAAAAASQNHPDDASRLIAQGDFWRQQGYLEQAISLYEQAVALKPSNFNRFVLESAYREAGQFAKSEALINTLWTEHPLSEETLSLRAGLLANEGKIDSAIAQYRRLLLLQNLRTQNTVNTRIALAQLLLNNKRLNAAEKEIESLIKLEPFNAAGYRLQGDLYSAQGQLQDSIYAYLNAFELDPTQIGVYLSLSNQLRLFGGQDERILDLLKTAVEINPTEPTLYLALGDELQERGQTQTAIEAYQTALNRFDTGALLPQQRGRSNEQSIAFAQTRLGRAYEALGAQAQALNHYQAAVSAVPEAGWAWVMLGDAHRRANNLEQASRAYQQALEKDPTFIDAYVSLAEMAIDQQAFEAAETYLQQAINADSQNERPYIRLGDVAELRGDYKQALAWYSQAASLAPTDETVNIALIDSLLRYGGYDTALQYVEQALQTQYGNSNLMLRQSQIQRALGQNETAEETLLAATEINATDVQLHTELAEFYIDDGQPQEAIETYLKGIAHQPAEPSYYTGISAILLNQAQPPEALAILQDGLSNAPTAEALYIAMAELHQQQGNAELALAVLEKGLDTAGESVNLRLALANYYLARAQFDEADSQLALALDLGTDSAAVHSALANLALHRGNTEEALTFHQQAIAFQPDNPAYLLALGNSYQQLERFDEAIATFQLAIQTEPGLANAYLALANAYQAQEQWDDARQAYEQGLTNAPDSLDILAQYGQFLLEQDNRESALSLLDKARSATNSINNRLGRASLYQTLELYSEAQTELESVLQQQPGNLNALLALGDLFLAQENYADAERAYYLVVNLAPGSPVGYLRLGRLASEQNDLTTAQEFADTARAVEPGAFGGN